MFPPSLSLPPCPLTSTIWRGEGTQSTLLSHSSFHTSQVSGFYWKVLHLQEFELWVTQCFHFFFPIFALWPLKLQADISKGLRNAVKFLWVKYIVLTQILCKFFLSPQTNIDLKKKKKKQGKQWTNPSNLCVQHHHSTPRFSLFILGW